MCKIKFRNLVCVRWRKDLSAWLNRLRTERLYRQGAAKLRALDERSLHDLGVSRSDIDAAARGLFR